MRTASPSFVIRISIGVPSSEYLRALSSRLSTTRRRNDEEREQQRVAEHCRDTERHRWTGHERDDRIAAAARAADRHPVVGPGLVVCFFGLWWCVCRCVLVFVGVVVCV